MSGVWKFLRERGHTVPPFFCIIWEFIRDISLFSWVIKAICSEGIGTGTNQMIIYTEQHR